MKGLTALAAATGAVVLLAGCAQVADSTPSSSAAPEFFAGASHVHAVDIDETTGFVHIASHEGILVAPMPHDGATVSEASLLGSWRGDAMGFTRVADRLFVSGHPAPQDEGPSALGVISTDVSGEGWETIALEGEVDFHAFAAGGSGPGTAMLAGLDSYSGSVYTSPDGGFGWQRGATLEARSLGWNADASTLFATTATGLQRSDDAGQTFQPVPDAPALVLLASSPPGAQRFLMAGIDVDGVLHRSVDGITWEPVGATPIVPDAIGVGELGAVVMATTESVWHSVDGGTTWVEIITL